MTLADFLNALNQNPTLSIFFFVVTPLTALLAWIFGNGESNISPWKYLYTILVYSALIPGIFAFILNIYLVVFKHESIMNFNLYTQILPIVSMVVSLWLISRNARFDDIPGFNRLSGLFVLLISFMLLLWILDRMQIFVISFMPFHYFIILLILILVVIRISAKRIFK
ncbi:MAG: hypothetical protein KDC16_05325 [Saprospiraceae bacterium]|nr:hypothetical protein [Saprospiraceae bacterium]